MIMNWRSSKNSPLWGRATLSLYLLREYYLLNDKTLNKVAWLLNHTITNFLWLWTDAYRKITPYGVGPPYHMILHSSWQLLHEYEWLNDKNLNKVAWLLNHTIISFLWLWTDAYRKITPYGAGPPYHYIFYANIIWARENNNESSRSQRILRKRRKQIQCRSDQNYKSLLHQS